MKRHCSSPAVGSTSGIAHRDKSQEREGMEGQGSEGTTEGSRGVTEESRLTMGESKVESELIMERLR